MRERFRLLATVAHARTASFQFSPSLLRTYDEYFTLKMVRNKGDEFPAKFIAPVMTEAHKLGIDRDRQ